TWVITLNGAGLTNNTLGDIVVSFGSDSEGKLRTLVAHTSLSTTGISLTIDADMTYHNPCGVMDAGVEDVTTDIASLLIDGMSYKLETVDWENKTFIEGEYTSVEYILAGVVIGTQDIVIATGTDKEAKGTFYGTLAYPDLTAYDVVNGYKAEWVTVYGKDDPLPDSRQIFAQYMACTFEITVVLKDETLTLDYVYDGDFEFPSRADEIERVAYFVDEEGNEYRTAEDLTALSGDTTLTAVYEKVEYTVTFVVGDERLVQKATYGDTIAYPASPEREGYTFAGWDSAQAIVTGNAEITALWTANTYSVTLVSKYEVEGFDWTENEDGSYTATLNFVY
ncbi:MAG: InlB B-repeat-containing protein, partial [Clostridiales bacterium]|nr:InlB B-repeat-containing protein [Clostridiales bacterium]